MADFPILLFSKLLIIEIYVNVSNIKVKYLFFKSSKSFQNGNWINYNITLSLDYVSKLVEVS